MPPCYTRFAIVHSRLQCTNAAFIGTSHCSGGSFEASGTSFRESSPALDVLQHTCCHRLVPKKRGEARDPHSGTAPCKHLVE